MVGHLGGGESLRLYEERVRGFDGLFGRTIAKVMIVSVVDRLSMVRGSLLISNSGLLKNYSRMLEAVRSSDLT